MNSETSPADATVTEGTAAPGKTRSNSFFRPKRAPLPRDDARRQGDINSPF